MGPSGGYIRYPSPYFFRFSSRAVSVDAALLYILHQGYHRAHTSGSNPWLASDSVDLPSQDTSLAGDDLDSSSAGDGGENEQETRTRLLQYVV